MFPQESAHIFPIPTFRNLQDFMLKIKLLGNQSRIFWKKHLETDIHTQKQIQRLPRTSKWSRSSSHESCWNRAEGIPTTVAPPRYGEPWDDGTGSLASKEQASLLCQRGQSAEVKLQCSFTLDRPLVTSSSLAPRECKEVGNEEGQRRTTSNSTLKDFMASNHSDWSVPGTQKSPFQFLFGQPGLMRVQFPKKGTHCHTRGSATDNLASWTLCAFSYKKATALHEP